MVKNSIKVYARLKNKESEKAQKITNYQIFRRNRHDDLIFDLRNETDPLLNKPHKYRFTKIFDQISTQVDVFTDIAKPIINSVFNGFNGTIFAYGQTGSGKTYSITGSPKRYEDRGILPRSIEQIFEYIKTTSTQYSVYVSYLEIYNEIGYDLLNSKHQPCRLEELPRVALLEDANGEAHLRNLCILPVTSEQEAMRLLFLGDTNRTIAETPMNEYSSRSHCIFTIYVTVTSEKSEKIRRSKLHLVDLAGSERIHKSKISGVTLNEAKHINLSLHYLEQVIVALSQSHRTHIPFRNSIMTYILRDSLAGNSLTAMLATLAITRGNIRETLTTCKFAQRVAYICTEATINEEIDPQKEILFLREEVDELRRQLIQLKGINANEKLSDKQEENCRKVVRDYVKGSAELTAELTAREMRFCLKLMKDNVDDYRKYNREGRHSSTNCDSNLALKYNEIIAEKDEEIDTLRQLLRATSQNSTRNNSSFDSLEKTRDSLEPIDLPSYDQDLYHKFKKDKGKDIEQMKLTLNKKYEIAKNIVATVQKCQDNIIRIRNKLISKHNTPNDSEKLHSYLLSQQNIYRDSLAQLENLKNETDFLKESLKQAENKLLYKFKREKEFIVEKDVENQFINNLSNIASCSSGSNVAFDDFNLLNFPKVNTYSSLLENQMFNNKRLPGVMSSTLSTSNFLSYPMKESYRKCNRNTTNLNDLSKKIFEGLDDSYLSEHCAHKNKNTNTHRINRPNTKDMLNDLLDDTHEADYDHRKSGDNRESKTEYKNFTRLRKDDDTPEFLDFMKTVPLTEDIEVDEEIFNFYRTKFTKK